MVGKNNLYVIWDYGWMGNSYNIVLDFSIRRTKDISRNIIKPMEIYYKPKDMVTYGM